MADKKSVTFGSQTSEAIGASTSKSYEEDVEEVRVVLIQFVETLLTVPPSVLTPSLDALVAMVAAACADPAPDVKRGGCTCAIGLATRCGDGLKEEHWDQLMAGVAFGQNAAILHQHAKVREAAIAAVGKIMPLAPSKMWDEALPKLKRVHLDRHGKVRLAVLRVLLDWVLQGAAATHTAQLLVQLLMGESDEVPEVSEFAEGAIASAASGRCPEAAGPLEAVEELLGAHLAQIVPEVVEDVVEWRSSTRLKAARTLVVVVKYGAEACEGHLDAFLPALFKGCRDDDDEVAKVIFEACEAPGGASLPHHGPKP